MRRIVEHELTCPLVGVRGPVSPGIASEQAKIPPWPKFLREWHKVSPKGESPPERI